MGTGKTKHELQAAVYRLTAENQSLKIELAKVQTAHRLLKSLQVRIVEKRERRRNTPVECELTRRGEAVAAEALARSARNQDSPKRPTK